MFKSMFQSFFLYFIALGPLLNIFKIFEWSAMDSVLGYNITGLVK